MKNNFNKAILVIITIVGFSLKMNAQDTTLCDFYNKVYKSARTNFESIKGNLILDNDNFKDWSVNTIIPSKFSKAKLSMVSLIKANYRKNNLPRTLYLDIYKGEDRSFALKTFKENIKDWTKCLKQSGKTMKVVRVQDWFDRTDIPERNRENDLACLIQEDNILVTFSIKTKVDTDYITLKETIIYIVDMNIEKNN